MHRHHYACNHGKWVVHSSVHTPPTLTSSLQQLSALESELEEFAGHEVIRAILEQGVVIQQHSADVGGRLRALELESIQDYIAESDNLVALHEQVSGSCCLCSLMLLQLAASQLVSCCSSHRAEPPCAHVGGCCLTSVACARSLAEAITDCRRNGLQEESSSCVSEQKLPLAALAKWYCCLATRAGDVHC
jgi:hypothetical protein